MAIRLKKSEMKRTFNLVDTSFAHDIGTTAGKTPKLWAWDRTLSNRDIPTFFTHEMIFEAPVGPECYGLLFESRAIIPAIYDNAPRVMDRFKYVFTHESTLLNLFPEKCKRIPGGGLWIGGPAGQGEIKLYQKSKLVSMVSSAKQICDLHTLRLQIALNLQNVDGIDVHIINGTKYIPIIDTLDHYMYSIVMENYVDDYYFTEKILNCFATGTIPIYLGARRIGDIFNGQGILSFNSWEELVQLLPILSTQDYQSRSEAIVENYQRCQVYDNIEDYIATHYGDLLPWHDAASAS